MRSCTANAGDQPTAQPNIHLAWGWLAASRAACPSHRKTTPFQGLARLEELVRKLTDLVTHRVEANLDAIRDTPLVDLPADRWVQMGGWGQMGG